MSAVLSPDGRKAIVLVEEGPVDLHLYDFDTGILSPFVKGGGAARPPSSRATGSG